VINSRIQKIIGKRTNNLQFNRRLGESLTVKMFWEFKIILTFGLMPLGYLDFNTFNA